MEVTDLTGFKFNVIRSSGGLFLVQGIKSDTVPYQFAYLHADGKIFKVALFNAYFSTLAEAENRLENLQIWGDAVVSATATCTCPSINLFNQGCTCGFLKGAGNG